ncbi:multi-sensor hybrid histidine kinase [Treponema primitia ZAS-2]|uniref:histidine kinase n=1 Tax=Treponema primitia (strain ATCC BAA-887 / DSM 12427 / ZAS-2) TaxID=545694 RepID=F5YNB5_TREPZ|nr:ATP-binding protein [Treponema primitia]AEF84408.1 multi-sensor hybrid histidine kinase [Treponema primitia ZAS-2]
MSLRIKVIYAITLIAVFIIVFGIGAGMFFTTTHMQTTIVNDMQVMADIADRLITADIYLFKSNTARAAGYLQHIPMDQLSSALKEQVDVNAEFTTLTVLDQNRVIASYGPSPTPLDVLDDTYIQRAFSGDMVVTTTRIDAAGVLVFHVLVPIDEERVLSATILGMRISDVLSDFTIWESGHIFVDDGEGYVLANPRPQWVLERYNFIEMAKTNSEYEGAAAMVHRMIQGETGVGRFSMDGVDRISVFRPITGSKSGWSLGVIAPLRESALSDVQNGLLLVGVICLLLSVFAAIFASSFIEKPYTTIHDMNTALEYQASVLHTINDAAAVLLQSDVERFEKDLHNCMDMFAKCVGVDRMRIWENSTIDGKLYCSQIYEWSEGAEPQEGKDITKNIPYDENIPGWEEKLSSGQCINGIVSTFSKAEQDQLSPQGIISILVIPVFFKEQFWGFVVFDDCRKERIFSLEEENLLRSGGLLIADSMLRNEMTLDLVQAREIALESTEAKSRFLANTSHEMRTPLNAIIGFSEMLLGSDSLQGENFENLEKIRNSGMTLLGIVNDVLDISKIESGKFEMIPVEYYTPSLINDTINFNIMRINDKPISFELHIDENLPEKLFGDELRVKQIFNNILSNAFKYTREGRVEWRLSFEQDGDSATSNAIPRAWIVSSISDSGIGIKPEDVQRLFSDYNQVDTKSNRTIEGTGLGLSITKKIVEMMDGSITVESEYGKGSTFTVRLRQGLVECNVIGKEIAEKLSEFNYTDDQRRQNSQFVRTRLPYARVLVVDDVPTNLDVAIGMMKPYGMQIDCVASGPAAIDLIRKEEIRYNAIFMDHMMPEMDGIEAVRIIREEIGTEYAKTVPIIALTANAIVGNEEMFLNHGFQAFLSKPIEIMRLDSAINHWIRDKNQETDLPTWENTTPMNDETPQGHTADLSIDPAFPVDTNIEDMDLQKGLDRFGGDPKLYTGVLKSYIQNTPPLLEQLKNCTAEALPAYSIVIHGIKSSSYGIGAQTAGALAEALENASKAGDFTFVQENNQGFILKAEALIAGLSDMLQSMEEERPKPHKVEPDKTTLAALLEACKLMDIKAVDKVMEELEHFSYDSGSDLVEWLRNQVNMSGFMEIEERLGQAQ